MWTSPTRPPSNWMNAPYGVIRCTVPSTAAPTSRSAMSSSSSGCWSEPHPLGVGELSHRDQGPSICSKPGRPDRIDGSTASRLRASVPGHDGERDLARHDHAEALPGQALQVGRVVEPLNALGQALVLMLEQLGLALELADLGAVGEQLPEREQHRDEERRDHHPQDRRARGEHGAPCDGVADRAHVRLRSESPPAYRAPSPSSSSIRSSWLYLAVRSPREGAPVLICPAFVATARSAIVVSSVSPERWLITTPYEACWAIRTTSRVSVSVPIWFSLTRMAFAASPSIPRSSR